MSTLAHVERIGTPAPTGNPLPIRLITAKTQGSTCYALGIVNGELFEQAIRVRNTPLAKMLAEKIHVLALRNEEWTFERVVQHARDEIEWAVAAQARRRFGSAFARGCG